MVYLSEKFGLPLCHQYFQQPTSKPFLDVTLYLSFTLPPGNKETGSPYQALEGAGARSCQRKEKEEEEETQVQAQKEEEI